MTNTNTSTVCIIILNWNGIADTLECLASIRKLDYPSCHIVVVDNGSHDGSQARLKAEHPEISLIELPMNLGFTGGSNAGIRYALARSADYVWLLNNDAVVEPNSLSVLVATANSQEDIALASPVIYDYPDTSRPQFWGIYADMTQQRLVVASMPEAGRPDPTSPLLWGTALLIRAAAVRRIGYLDDRYFAYHEDLDYSLRALAAGFRTVVEPGAVIYHKADSASRIESPFKGYLFSRNLFLFWSTHLHGLSRYTYPPKYIAWAIHQAVHLREAGNQTAADACLDGAWSALRGRYGPPGNNPIAMPELLRRIIWRHPQFWIWLLTGRFTHILWALAARLLRRA